jgi:hypothetical protein
MRKGLRPVEEKHIAELTELGRTREELYDIFQVQPSAIDECVDAIDAVAAKVTKKEEAKQAKLQKAIDDGVEVSLAKKAKKAK